MSPSAKFPVWYSVISVSLSLLVMVLMLINYLASNTGAWFRDVFFFLLVISYMNCLPLAIVSIFLFFRKKELRGYCLMNFAVIVIVLYIAVKVFGKAL